MSKIKDVRMTLVNMIQTVAAPLPLNCRMLPDNTIVDLNTKERISQLELNRRYLASILMALDIPLPAPLPMKIAEKENE